MVSGFEPFGAEMLKSNDLCYVNDEFAHRRDVR